MNDTSLIGLLVAPIVVYLAYLKIKDDVFGPKRLEPATDGIGLAVILFYLAAFFMATVFNHPEARIGWFVGLLCGALLGFFDLRVTRIRNTPGGILAYSSRVIAAGFLVAGTFWSAIDGGRGQISVENASESPASMFFCTTLLTYVVVYINGLYGGRQFESASPQRNAVARPFERIENGRRRGQR